VELLQESKAFYVKSETVLDRKQELRNSGHLQVTSSAVDTVFFRGPLLKKSSSGPTWVNNVQNQDPGSRPEQDNGRCKFFLGTYYSSICGTVPVVSEMYL
jgi:hypothetical protein